MAGGYSPAAAAKLAEKNARNAADVKDAGAAADASVLDGLVKPVTETPATTPASANGKAPRRSRAKVTVTKGEPVPPKAPAVTPVSPKAPRTRKAPATPAATAPETPAPARRGRKPVAPAPAPEPVPAASANGSKRLPKNTLAREVLELLADHFADYSDADRERVSYWVHGLPTGANDEGKRWWPAGTLPRPTTADWIGR